MGESALKDFTEPKSEDTKATNYQELLGCLPFLSTRTRPDISSAVASQCRFALTPKLIHWTALKLVLRYVNWTKEFVLQIVLENDKKAWRVMQR